MKRGLLATVIIALAMTSFAASSATVRTKVGRVRITPQNGVETSILRFGREDGGTFDGCTKEPGFVFTQRTRSPTQPLNSADALALLLSAKQNNFEVAVGYVVQGDGACVLRSLELQ